MQKYHLLGTMFKHKSLYLAPLKCFSTINQGARANPKNDSSKSFINANNQQLSGINSKISSLIIQYCNNVHQMVDPSLQEGFRQKNNTQIKEFEDQIQTKLKQTTKLDEQDLIIFSKFLNILSLNSELTNNYTNKLLEGMRHINLGPLIETTWYLCLKDDIKNKKQLLELFFSQLQHKLPNNINQNYSMAYKVMLSQILMEAQQPNFKEQNFPFMNNTPENLEIISIDDFGISFYEEMASFLKKEKQEIVHINNFLGIYNIAIQMNQNKIIEFFNLSIKKELNSISKAIRCKHIKNLGFQIIPVYLDNIRSKQDQFKVLKDSIKL
jgi:hypothetical protein